MHPKKEESLNISTPINPPHWLAGSSTALKAQPGLMSVFYSQPSPPSLPPRPLLPMLLRKQKQVSQMMLRVGAKNLASGKKWISEGRQMERKGGAIGAIWSQVWAVRVVRAVQAVRANWCHLIPSRKCFINFWKLPIARSLLSSTPNRHQHHQTLSHHDTNTNSHHDPNTNTNANTNTYRDGHERWHFATVQGLQRSGKNQTDNNLLSIEFLNNNFITQILSKNFVT